jgi:hypothetical protein
MQEVLFFIGGVIGREIIFLARMMLFDFIKQYALKPTEAWIIKEMDIQGSPFRHYLLQHPKSPYKCTKQACKKI